MFEKNRVSFTDICRNGFGRKVIYSNAESIDEKNIVQELAKALSIHWKNREEILYLDRYYSGDQPILYRHKHIRPEINNKIVENHAFEIVEHKTAENFGEPIQYVLDGSDEKKSTAIKTLNSFMKSDDKGCIDIEIGRWRSICGTGYRFIWNNKDYNSSLGETPFGICSENPMDTFVVYSSSNGKEPLYSCQIRKDTNGLTYYFIYTMTQTFKVQNSKVIETPGTNGLFEIPVVEYPNNERRLSDIEIVITLLDSINKMQSDRMNGIEQFIQAIVKFINCDIDETKFREMCQIGMMKVTGGQNVRADVDLMTAELDQQQSQTAKDDLYNNVLIVEGMPSREQNTGGDTGQAVYLRNGWDFSEKRAELSEPIFKKSERRFLKIVLRMLKVKKKLESLELGDIEIKVTRSKTDNMVVKAQVLQTLLTAGLEPKIAIKVCSLFSDPEEVFILSQDYLKAKYKTKDEKSKEESQGGDNNDDTNPLPQLW